jgi:transcriptional regulator with PAS, ATPase and Fis domain
MNLQNELIERYAEQFPDSRIGKCIKIIERAARMKTNLLIQGETGTGKTTLINFVGKKIFTAKPPVTVSCFNLSGELFQSVLCGHLKGAFTGAVETTEGKAQTANNGVLFFDDVDTLTMDNQSKLLYFLDYHVCEKVGSTMPELLNLWTAFSTNSNIEEKITAGFMREDFYYRISTIKVNIPPLRDRPNFIRYFIANYLESLKISYSKKFMEECLGYVWPGNIREMTSALDRIRILNYDGYERVRSLKECGIRADEKISGGVHSGRQNITAAENYHGELKQNGGESGEKNIFDITSEKNRIMCALKKAKYKRNKACKILDISYSTLWRKLKRYEIYEKLR